MTPAVWDRQWVLAALHSYDWAGYIEKFGMPPLYDETRRRKNTAYWRRRAAFQVTQRRKHAAR